MRRACFAVAVALLWSPLLGLWLVDGGSGPLNLSARQAGLLASSALMALATGVLATLLGSALALRLSRLSGRSALLAQAALAGAAVLPAVVVASGAMAAFARVTPLVQHGLVPTVIVQSLAFSPLSAWIMLGAIRTLSREQVETAAVSSPPARAFFGVVVPMVKPALATSVSLAAILALVDFTTPSLFLAKTYSQEVFADLSAGRSGFALITPVIVLAAPFAAFSAYFARGFVRSRGSAPDRIPVPSAVVASARVCSAFVVAVFCSLIIALVFETGSFQTLSASVSNASSDLASSFRFALGASVVAALFALVASPQLSVCRSPVAWAVVLLPLAFPAGIVGMGLARLGTVTGIDAIAHPVFAQALRSAPIFIAVFALAWSRIDVRLLESAKLAASRLRQATQVWLPLAAPGLLLGAVLTLLVSLGELEATLAVVPPGESTVLVRLFNLLHYGSSSEAAAVSLALVAIVVGLVAATLVIFGRKRLDRAV